MKIGANAENIGVSGRRFWGANMTYCLRSLFLAAGCTAAMAAPAFAQTGGAGTPTTQTGAATQAGTGSKIEIVTVTARRRSEDVEKVPLSVTVLRQKELSARQIYVISDLKFATPSLNTQSVYGNSSSAGYSIRGFGANLAGSSVTSYFSEVPEAGPSNGALFDLASVQVLKGPQGTLFGRATTGGAIVFTPQHPNLENWEGSFDAVEGSYGRNNITGVLDIPLIKDELGVRIAVHREHTDGYTHIIGTSSNLDQTNQEFVRVGIEWRPTDNFENYFVFKGGFVDQSAGGEVLVGFDPTNTLFNLPPDTSTFLGAIFGNALFGGLCTAAVSDGLSPSVTACEDQRLGLLHNLKPALTAELARTSAGGNAVRSTHFSTSAPAVEKSNNYDFVDNAQLHLGDLGFSDVTLKNNFSYSLRNSFHCVDADGIAASLVETCFALGPNLAAGHAIQVGNQGIPGLGPLQSSLAEEFQVTGTYDDDLLVWLLGFYYSSVPSGTDTTGCANQNKVFEGVFTENLGQGCAYVMPISGDAWERGVFGNAVLDLSRWIVPGLHFTAGVRTTSDSTSSTSAAPVYSYPSGTLHQGAITVAPVVKTSGMGWTVALNYEVTDDLMIYATANRGYKPGGLNNTVGAAGAPGFTPTFAPESVIEWELGEKARFNIDGIEGILNVDYFHNTYTNIQEPLIARIGANTFNYNENVAGAMLQGVEVETQIQPTDNLQITGEYAYLDAHFSKYFAADPLGLAGPGNPACYAPLSTPTFCVLDLHKTPFPTSTKHQGSLTLRYQAPIPDDAGKLFASITGYIQSREYFSGNAARELAVYGPSMGVENYRNQISQPTYELLNARIDWEHIYGSGITGSLWVNNLTNQTYSTGSTNGITVIAALGINSKTFAPPRMFGIELNYEFGP